jgi:hypothetical protein
LKALSEASLQQDLREAMKGRAADRVSVLRGLIAAIKNYRIERRTGGTDAEVGEAEITQLVRREIKQREEAIEFAERASRSDLVQKNRFEREVLEGFLPNALTTEELETAVRTHHQAGAANIGALMAKLKEEFGPRLDGKTASAFVKEFLTRQGGS